MQFTLHAIHLCIFLIKSISLYRKPKYLIYFMQIFYVITLLFMDNILKLKILAIHEIIPQYYYRIYTVLHVLTILNVHTQYWVLTNDLHPHGDNFSSFFKLVIHKVYHIIPWDFIHSVHIQFELNSKMIYTFGWLS